MTFYFSLAPESRCWLFRPVVAIIGFAVGYTLASSAHFFIDV